MFEEIGQQLEKVLNSGIKGDYTLLKEEGKQIKVNIGDNGVFLTAYFENPQVDKKDFKEYIDALDDDVFLDACTEYAKKNDLYKFSDLVTDANVEASKYRASVEEFKECVKAASIRKINNIIDTSELDIDHVG